MPKIAKQIVVCLFALLIPAYLMRDQPEYLPVLIPAGIIAILNLMFFNSRRAIAWAKERIKSLLVGGVCTALVGFLLMLILAHSGGSEFVLALPAIAILVGIWMFSLASVVKTFYAR